MITSSACCACQIAITITLILWTPLFACQVRFVPSKSERWPSEPRPDLNIGPRSSQCRDARSVKPRERHPGPVRERIESETGRRRERRRTGATGRIRGSHRCRPSTDAAPRLNRRLDRRPAVRAQLGTHAILAPWRGGRVAEGAALEKRYTASPYRGFESRPLRQPNDAALSRIPILSRSCLCLAHPGNRYGGSSSSWRGARVADWARLESACPG